MDPDRRHHPIASAVLKRRLKFEIEVTPDADRHLSALVAHDRALILDSLEPHLSSDFVLVTYAYSLTWSTNRGPL
jgi:hypothetical protein